jgi:hypothetical protein
MLPHIKYESFRKWSVLAKNVVCRTVLYIEATQALWNERGQHAAKQTTSVSMLAYKNPRPRTMVNVALVRMFNCRFQTSGTGNTARVVSVMMLTTVNLSAELTAAFPRGGQLTAVVQANCGKSVGGKAFCMSSE